MDVLMMVVGSGVVLVVAYLTFGRWLSRRVFALDDATPTPAVELNDGTDYVPTRKWILFGHHFASIAGVGAIIGPMLAVMWGWLPALVVVVLGSIFLGAVHDMGAVVVSMRNRGRSICDIAGDVLGTRARWIFFVIAMFSLWIVLAALGLVITTVFQRYPSAVLPVVLQIPVAMTLGLVIRRARIRTVIPTIIALAMMYASVFWGDVGGVITQNHLIKYDITWMWMVGLLVYAAMASLLPAWCLNQPRGYTNGLFVMSAMVLVVVGLIVAAVKNGGGAPASSEEHSRSLSLVAPMLNWNPGGAPPMFPMLFIILGGAACSGFHALVGSGASSKLIAREREVKGVGYGAMIVQAFLGVVVIAACAGGIGMGTRDELYGSFQPVKNQKLCKDTWLWLGVDESSGLGGNICGIVFTERDALPGNPTVVDPNRTDARVVHIGLYRVPIAGGVSWSSSRSGSMTTRQIIESINPTTMVNGVNTPVPKIRGLSNDRCLGWIDVPGGAFRISPDGQNYEVVGYRAYLSHSFSRSWNKIGDYVDAFIQGGANFLTALRLPRDFAITLLAVLVTSLAATTLETSCRLQRYVVQESAGAILIGRRPRRSYATCPGCGYDLTGIDPEHVCPECGTKSTDQERRTEGAAKAALVNASWWNPIKWLATPPGATVCAVVTAAALAAAPIYGLQWRLAYAGCGAINLWPVFGAVNALLAGSALVVIIAWLRMTGRPWWFAVVPALIMLVVPAWALAWQALVGNADNPSWAADKKWVLVAIAGIALTLEAWMVTEAVVRWRRMKPEEKAS